MGLLILPPLAFHMAALRHVIRLRFLETRANRNNQYAILTRLQNFLLAEERYERRKKNYCTVMLSILHQVLVNRNVRAGGLCHGHNEKFSGCWNSSG
jgi:hypothetical protein